MVTNAVSYTTRWGTICMFGKSVRIPMKPATYSDLKPASHSDFMPATVPI